MEVISGKGYLRQVVRGGNKEVTHVACHDPVNPVVFHLRRVIQEQPEGLEKSLDSGENEID